MKKYVIIPSYDPDETLIRLIEENIQSGHTVIVVDDGSHPQCASVFYQAGTLAKVLSHEINRGKGEAIKTALTYIQKKDQGPYRVGIMDCDGQHLTYDLDRLFSAAECEPDALFLGVRTFRSNTPWKSRLGNKLTRTLFRLQTGYKLSDTQTGLRVFSDRLVSWFTEVPGSRYEYEMNMLFCCIKKEIPIREVPISTIYLDFENSTSHFHKVKDSVRIYEQMLRFSLISVSGFIADYLLFMLFAFLLPDTAFYISFCNICARILSGIYNYRMNTAFVFHRPPAVQTALEYMLLACAILFLNTVILNFFHLWLHIPLYAAKILTECALFLVSFIVQHKIIFGKQGEAA